MAAEEWDQYVIGAIEALFGPVPRIAEEFRREMLEREQMREDAIRERRKEQLAMTMTRPVRPTIQLETGEDRIDKFHSARLFFVYVTPTGVEVPITKCPSLTKIGSKATGGFDGGSRRVLTDYELRAPTMLKMVNIVSKLGTQKRVANLFIHTGPEEASIQLVGMDGFGKFKGRGKVLYDLSSLREDKINTPITLQVLKDIFGMTMLQPPIKSGVCAPRSMIFD
jgi:hypothetical protein